MRLNVLQHTPNEGPGMIEDWAQLNDYEMFVYHPYKFGILPTVEETDMLVILGGPMSPNDDIDWIRQERVLIKQCLDRNIPMFGACYGDQQISKTLGYRVGKSPVKEVGWAPVYLQSDIISSIPQELLVLHWHEEMFEVPASADLLFSSTGLTNQGFVMNHKVVGLQFHFEPGPDNVREMVVNDSGYLQDSVLQQTTEEVLQTPVPDANRSTLFKILDYITD